MNQKLYVGNLPFQASEDELSSMFAAHGTVVSARIITDRETGRSKGFGFIEMETEDQAKQAVEGLDGQDFSGRPLRVSVAKPQAPRTGGGNRGGGGGRRY